MREVWKQLPSDWNYIISNRGGVKRRRPFMDKKQSNHSNGYLQTSIRNKSFLVHRLVLETFSDIPNGKVVNHLNGVKTDNRLINLEATTYSGNNKHAIDTGLRKVASKLNEAQVACIKKLLKSKKYGRAEIAKMFLVSYSAIRDIDTRKNWKQVKEQQ